jgi:hypothetical protein
MSADRERFQAWYASDAFPFARSTSFSLYGFSKRHADEYVCSDVQEKWLTWQAAIAATAKECAEICHALATAMPSKGQAGFSPYSEGCADWARECADHILLRFEGEK